MKAILVLSAALSVPFLTAGCASVDDAKTTAEAKPAREYRTGSNIPVKDSTPPTSDAEREKTAEAVRGLQRTGSSGKPGG